VFSEVLPAEGGIVFAKACELGPEGIVSKREGSFCKSGRSRKWLKRRWKKRSPAFKPCLW